MITKPIAIFAFNRFYHFKKTVDSLINCEHSDETIVYFFLDAPLNYYDNSNFIKIKNYIDSINYFKEKIVICRDYNYGLRDNIISGINFVFEKYDAVIVLEDDLILSKDFLKYMNYCLNNYAENKNIWHVNGWSHPANKYNEILIYSHWKMNCWGWGTWRDRWQNFSINPAKLIKESSPEIIKKINMDGHSSNYSQITANFFKRKKTWAIFWQVIILNNGGECITPTYSFVDNIGFDNSGINSRSNNKVYNSSNLHCKVIFDETKINHLIEYNNEINNMLLSYYSLNRTPLIYKIIFKLELIIAKLLVKYEYIIR